MAKTIRIRQTGGPDVLSIEEMQVGDPKANEVLLRQTAIGVNYVDTYHRSGFYPVTLPSGIGGEAAGVVEAVGPSVTTFRVGERVAYATFGLGSYAERRLVPVDRLVRLPASISDEQAAGMLLKGLTVWYLIRKIYPAKSGDTVLWHAAAGGVGLIACQWLRALGVTVIGTVGSDAKAALAAQHGCSHCIVYSRDDFVAGVRKITGGVGVPVVYDPVGKSTWEGSLDCLRPRGLMVSFGNASGPVGMIDPLVLTTKGSLFLTRPSLAHYASTQHELDEGARELLGMVTSGQIKIEVSARYSLADAARAHRDLESRRTSGSIVLIP